MMETLPMVRVLGATRPSRPFSHSLAAFSNVGGNVRRVIWFQLSSSFRRRCFSASRATVFD
jgi:hypothetical protein